ncbi:MAG: BolA/IbaG family iron-sulfur metabolism protein [Gammaproteobacteria bacterium]|nr:BolA/IbaG family iron-sulfur metabolism protein [Gammaproteobacteria bacterium]
MTPDKLQSLLTDGLEDATVTADGDGSHFQVTVVSNQFDGLRPVKRQQLVYSLLTEHITSGDMHAIGIKAYTESEWKTASKLQVG